MITLECMKLWSSFGCIAESEVWSDEAFQGVVEAGSNWLEVLSTLAHLRRVGFVLADHDGRSFLDRPDPLLQFCSEMLSAQVSLQAVREALDEPLVGTLSKRVVSRFLSPSLYGGLDYELRCRESVVL